MREKLRVTVEDMTTKTTRIEDHRERGHAGAETEHWQMLSMSYEVYCLSFVKWGGGRVDLLKSCIQADFKGIKDRHESRLRLSRCSVLAVVFVSRFSIFRF